MAGFMIEKTERFLGSNTYTEQSTFEFTNSAINVKVILNSKLNFGNFFFRIQVASFAVILSIISVSFS